MHAHYGIVQGATQLPHGMARLPQREPDSLAEDRSAPSSAAMEQCPPHGSIYVSTLVNADRNGF